MARVLRMPRSRKIFCSNGWAGRKGGKEPQTHSSFNRQVLYCLSRLIISTFPEHYKQSEFLTNSSVDGNASIRGKEFLQWPKLFPPGGHKHTYASCQAFHHTPGPQPAAILHVIAPWSSWCLFYVLTTCVFNAEQKLQGSPL